MEKDIHLKLVVRVGNGIFVYLLSDVIYNRLKDEDKTKEKQRIEHYLKTVYNTLDLEIKFYNL